MTGDERNNSSRLFFSSYLLYLSVCEDGSRPAEPAECGSSEARQTAQRRGDPQTHIRRAEV